MKALMIADPLENLKPSGDTSLVILHELFSEKIETFYCVPDDLLWNRLELSIRARPVIHSERGKLPTLGSQERIPISNFKWVFIRKDPPFDQSYVKLVWLLAAFENEVTFINQPSLLLRHHEKMLALEGVRQKFLQPQDLIPTCFSSTLEGAKDFVESIESEKVVLKPYFGFGGNGVLLFNRKDFYKEAAKYFAMSKDWIIQPFEDSVYEKGDARVFFIRGKFSGAVSRIPKEGSYLSNLGQGGRAQLSHFSEEEMALVSRLEKWIQKLGIDFVGADFISGKVNELNITSPTGFVSFESLTNQNLAKVLIGGMKRN